MCILLFEGRVKRPSSRGYRLYTNGNEEHAKGGNLNVDPFHWSSDASFQTLSPASPFVVESKRSTTLGLSHGHSKMFEAWGPAQSHTELVLSWEAESASNAMREMQEKWNDLRINHPTGGFL